MGKAGQSASAVPAQKSTGTLVEATTKAQVQAKSKAENTAMDVAVGGHTPREEWVAEPVQKEERRKEGRMRRRVARGKSFTPRLAPIYEEGPAIGAEGQTAMAGRVPTAGVKLSKNSGTQAGGNFDRGADVRAVASRWDKFSASARGWRTCRQLQGLVHMVCTYDVLPVQKWRRMISSLVGKFNDRANQLIRRDARALAAAAYRAAKWHKGRRGAASQRKDHRKGVAYTCPVIQGVRGVNKSQATSWAGGAGEEAIPATGQGAKGTPEGASPRQRKPAQGNTGDVEVGQLGAGLKGCAGPGAQHQQEQWAENGEYVQAVGALGAEHSHILEHIAPGGQWAKTQVTGQECTEWSRKGKMWLGDQAEESTPRPWCVVERHLAGDAKHSHKVHVALAVPAVEPRSQRCGVAALVHCMQVLGQMGEVEAYRRVEAAVDTVIDNAERSMITSLEVDKRVGLSKATVEKVALLLFEQEVKRGELEVVSQDALFSKRKLLSEEARQRMACGLRVMFVVLECGPTSAHMGHIPAIVDTL